MHRQHSGHVISTRRSSGRRCTSEALLVEIGLVSARREPMYRQSPHHPGRSSQRKILQETVVLDADDESRLIQIAALPGGSPAVQRRPYRVTVRVTDGQQLAEGPVRRIEVTGRVG